MPHTIILTEPDQETILRALLASLEDKHQHVIRDPKKFEATRQQYELAGEKFMQPVICGSRGLRPRDNLFGWLIDQIEHSPHVRTSTIGQRAIAIAQAAAQNRYGVYTQSSNPQFGKLFE